MGSADVHGVTLFSEPRWDCQMKDGKVATAFSRAPDCKRRGDKIPRPPEGNSGLYLTGHAHPQHSITPLYPSLAGSLEALKFGPKWIVDGGLDGFWPATVIHWSGDWQITAQRRRICEALAGWGDGEAPTGWGMRDWIWLRGRGNLAERVR